jgi:hypothetical protein
MELYVAASAWHKWKKVSMWIFLAGNEKGDVAPVDTRVDERLSMADLQGLRHSVARGPTIR